MEYLINDRELLHKSDIYVWMYGHIKELNSVVSLF